MIDYLSYPESSIVAVFRPRDRKSCGVPEQLRRRYRRTQAEQRRAGDTEHVGAWYLPDDDPAWGEIVPMKEVRAIYAAARRTKTPAGPAFNAGARAAALARKEAITQWWRDVRALPGGCDPLWRYGTDGQDDKSDEVYTMLHETAAGPAPWFPRTRLKLSYGTTSLREYAKNNGLDDPWEATP